MTLLGKGARLALRSLFVQASWNQRTLLGSGVAWVLLPFRKGRGGGNGKREWVATAAEPFNAHPYLVPIALGALLRAEEEGADPERIRRFRTALQSPLGSLGDSLFWASWRPACLLAGAIVALLGGNPIAVVVGVLLVYNVPHLAIRLWGAIAGLRLGFDVGGALAGLRLQLWTERIRSVAVLTLGFLLGQLLVRGIELPAYGAPCWVGALFMGTLGGRGRELRRGVVPLTFFLLILGAILLAPYLGRLR